MIFCENRPRGGCRVYFLFGRKQLSIDDGHLSCVSPCANTHHSAAAHDVLCSDAPNDNAKHMSKVLVG